jgi:hypothetical protein
MVSGVSGQLAFSSNYLKHYLSMVSGVSGQLAQRAELDELDSKV